jgi:HSP20 family protein
MPGFYASVWGSPAMQQWQKQAQQTVQEAAQQQGLWFPVDVLESDTQYQYVADVPGLGKSDIQVQVDKDRMLTVSGERAFKEAATASKADSAPPTTEQAGTSDAVDVTDSSQDTQEQQKPEWRRTRKERRFGSFKRSWTLPEDADLSRINARVEKGVLTLTVNRVKPVEPEVTTINID